MSHSFAALFVHAVFSTKGRRRLLAPEWRPALWSQFGRTALKHGQKLVAAGDVEDYVHLLLSLGPTAAPCDIVRKLKASSSQWISAKKRVPHFAWQVGYGVFSVSRSNLDVVTRYLRRQEEHHQDQTFEDEFRELLDRHGVEYDAEAVFD